MERTNRSPAEHIASLPAERRADIEGLDALLTTLVAGQPKTMWEGRPWGGSDQQIIGYGGNGSNFVPTIMGSRSVRRSVPVAMVPPPR